MLLGAPTVKRHVVAALDAARAASSPPPSDAVVEDAIVRLTSEARRGLTGVLNATGIVLHTNLGRAPLAREAIDAIAQTAAGASNLEFDLESGARGSRYDRLGALLRAATGAEDALVVNNCAAGVLLILDTFARAPDGSAREVIVARNQLVEIGGGFRLPDVLARSGARLVEVGATNKVRIEDYARALTPQSALFLRAHPSNYRIEGFTADVPPAELVALGARAGVPVVEDLGSGALVDLRAYNLPHERTVQEAIADGIDLVAFSGDKLLGGPQAGIIVGRASAIARLRTNPLLRALRVGATTIAALGATLRLHLDPDAREGIPFYRMLGTPLDRLRARADALQARLDGLDLSVVEHDGYAGAGSLQEKYLSALLADLHRTVDDLGANYRGLLPMFLLGAAQIAADREADSAQLVLKDIALQVVLDRLKADITKTETIGGGIGRISVTFGHVAENAVNAVSQRVFKDGLNLSDRLWRLDRDTRKAIEDRVIQAVAQQTSARDLAKDLRAYLTDAGQGNGRYNAMRLARTEINNAHREGHIRSCTDENGDLKAYIQAIGWRLSMSHPSPDICDVWASQDVDGLGAGNYLPGSVPVDHAHGLCMTVTILKAYPDKQFVTTEPKPDDVPQSQLQAYGIQEQ